MMNGTGSRWHKQHGQAVTEFALVLPIILMVVIGITDLGRGIYYYNTLSNLAREGARFGMVLQSSDWDVDGNEPGEYTSIGTYAGTNTIVGRIAAQAVILDPSITKVTISTPSGTGSFLHLPVTVAVEYPFSPLFSQWIHSVPVTKISAESTMRIE